MIKIIITNGYASTGKDSFINLAKKHYPNIENYSSVDKVKEIAEIIGWNPSQKTEKDRKFLSDLKLLCSDYNNLPFEDLKEKVNKFFLKSEDRIIFLHVREPVEIEKFKQYYQSNCITLLVVNNRVKYITSNMADEGVYDYAYDIVIENEGSLEDLEDSAKTFIEWLLS